MERLPTLWGDVTIDSSGLYYACTVFDIGLRVKRFQICVSV